MIQAAHKTIVAMRNTSSKNDKIAILQAQKGNAFLKEYLRLMYEARVNFYMKKVDPKAGNKMSKVAGEPFSMKTLDWLKANICTRNISGNAAKTAVADLYNGFRSDAEKELLALLINRDAKSGFGANTINKVWKDLVTDVPYMRCCLPDKTDLSKFPWADGVYSELKCDGMFANVTHTKSGEVTIASRSGSPFPTNMFPKLVAEVKAKIPAGAQIHSELLMYRNGKVLERQDSNGRFNKILQGGDLEAGLDIVCVAWDMIPETEAKAKNKYKVPYSTRFGSLIKCIGKTNNVASPLQVVTYKTVYSLKEAYEHYKEVLEAGFEGTIIKHPDMIWEDTTSKYQVKLKLECEVELKVVAFNPGNGKNEDLFGSLQCVSADGQLECGATGLSDDLRQELFDDPKTIGSIITVKSNSLMKPSRGNPKYSLFLPRFVEVRLDKKKANTLKEIQDQFDAAIASVANI